MYHTVRNFCGVLFCSSLIHVEFEPLTPTRGKLIIMLSNCYFKPVEKPEFSYSIFEYKLCIRSYRIARKFGVLKFGELTSKEVWRLKFSQTFNFVLASMELYQFGD